MRNSGPCARLVPNLEQQPRRPAPGVDGGVGAHFGTRRRGVDRVASQSGGNRRLETVLAVTVWNFAAIQ